ncbi:hypothetical protein MFRU_003g03880 [Monilinia fructicola]|nr:hypothetical protein MFRU_003g03880 [Monilinia fructicola]
MADHLTDAPGTHDVEATHHQPAILGEGLASEENTETVPESGETRRGSDFSKSQSSLGLGAREESDSEKGPRDQSTLNQALLDAARLEIEAEVIELLAQGADLSAVDEDGWTALFYTVEFECLDATRAIISKYPDSVNIQNDESETALHLAIKRNNLEIVKLLVANNDDANIDIRDKDGRTALHYACSSLSNISPKCIDLLLQKGANIDLKDNDGDTALIFAILRAKKELAEALLLKKANVDIQNNHGATALHCVEYGISQKVIDLLVEKVANVDLKDNNGNTALIHAVGSGNLKLVQGLLSKKAKVDIRNDDGYSALQIASRRTYDFGSRYYDYNEAVIKKLSMAMKPQQRKDELMRIVSVEEKEYIDYILENMDWAGLEKEREAFEKKIGLIWNACRGAKHEDARIILKNMYSDKVSGARKTDLEEWTALEWAAYVADHVVVWWLLVSGSREEIDIHRKRALELAERQKENEKDKQDDYSLTIDILKDPPLVQGWSEPDESYGYPKLYNVSKQSSEDPHGPEKLLQNFEGTIVDFYRHEKSTRVDFLRRSRTVWDIIYGKPKEPGNDKSQGECTTSGPKMIMKESMQNLEKIRSNSELAKQESYSEEDLQLRWVHLPANNKEKVLLGKELEERDQNHAEGYTSEKTALKSNLKNNKSKEYWRTALYIPYLTFSTYSETGAELTKSGKKVEKLLKAYGIQNKNDNEDSDMATGNDSRRIIHSSRTLDQFYYHSLKDTKSRDSDQVVTRYTHYESRVDKALDILRVDELWLWVIDEETVITSSTSRLDDKEDPVLEGIFESLRKAKGKSKSKPPPSSVDEMCKYIINYCIEFFDRPALECKRDKDMLSVRQIFSNSINNATNKEMELFTTFKKKIDDKVKQQSHDHDISNQSRPKSEDEGKSYNAIGNAANLLHEVKDIRDELNILKYLLEQQTAVWERLLETPTDTDELHQRSGLPRFKETGRWKGPGPAIKSVLEMDKLAQRIQDSVNSVLSLEQNEANLSEAESARKQGKIMMVFTIITIVFLPMSFLVSLFALDVTSFPHENGNLKYTPGFIFSITFGVTAAVSIPAIIYAFLDIFRGLFEDFVTPMHKALTQHPSKNHPERTIDSSKASPNKNNSVETNGTSRPGQLTPVPSESKNSSSTQNNGSRTRKEIIEQSNQREKSSSSISRQLRGRHHIDDLESQVTSA